VDCAVYHDGHRSDRAVDMSSALDVCEQLGGFVWIGLHEPTESEFEAVAQRFALHPLAVEDAVHAHQRPKLERYGDSSFMVLKPARYVDHEEVVEIDQIMLFIGDAFVISVRHGQSSALAEVRHELEADPKRLAWGPLSVLHAVADKVVDDYHRVLAGLAIDIDEIETAVFSGPRSSHAGRIFKLKREVLEFRRAVDPLAEPLEQLSGGTMLASPDAAPYFRDVHDHVMRVRDNLNSLDDLLQTALSANVAQVGMRQNEDMRKISAWVAIIALPTMIAGIYGMNFEHMPELEWTFGYPLVVGVMIVSCFLLYRNFKRRDWL